MQGFITNHYHVHSQPLAPILSQMNSVHTSSSTQNTESLVTASVCLHQFFFFFFEDQSNYQIHSCTAQYCKCWRTKWNTHSSIMEDNHFWWYNGSHLAVKHNEEFYWCKVSEGWTYGTFYVKWRKHSLAWKLSVVRGCLLTVKSIIYISGAFHWGSELRGERGFYCTEFKYNN